MSLIAEQLAAAAERKPNPCIVGRFITERLDDEDRQVLERMFARPRTGNIIHAVLSENGLEASASSVVNHIAARCGCPKGTATP